LNFFSFFWDVSLKWLVGAFIYVTALCLSLDCKPHESKAICLVCSKLNKIATWNGSISFLNI
jgi:hypothetical protein